MPLPPPSPEETAHSERMRSLIQGEIERAGWVSFARYMELALYSPGLGYYSSGRLGTDFVTAPEMSPLFARTLARQAIEILDQCGGGILEFGAGSGRLALDLMRELKSLGKLPTRYSIIELSVELAARQRQLIAGHAPQWLDRFEWLAKLPERFGGLVLANEVLDAMPVHIVAWREDGLYERGVALKQGRFVWGENKLDEGRLFEAASRLDIAPNYVSEIGLGAGAFIATLANILERGALLLIDYGFGESEYYHPQRSAGTLMCHYRNQAHDDPFYLPGMQDITSHVDFSAVAQSGISSGLELLGYTTQANFLINCGITDLLRGTPAEDIVQYLPLSTATQKLLSPSEMGELFKVIALGKNVNAPLIGFDQGDKSHLL
jgi:SAM-dependent MidA family methyltransferase